MIARRVRHRRVSSQLNGMGHNVHHDDVSAKSVPENHARTEPELPGKTASLSENGCPPDAGGLPFSCVDCRVLLPNEAGRF